MKTHNLYRCKECGNHLAPPINTKAIIERSRDPWAGHERGCLSYAKEIMNDPDASAEDKAAAFGSARIWIQQKLKARVSGMSPRRDRYGQRIVI